MSGQVYYLEWMFRFGLIVAGVALPVVLLVLLTVWLINKRRRDDMIIQRLATIHQTLADLRERLEQPLDKKR